LANSNQRLSVVIGGVPQGSVLSSGLNDGDGSWTLTAAQLTGLSITPPSGYTGDMNLTARAYSLENGYSTSAQDDFVIHIDDVPIDL
jgi:hypothetical protein